jgi:hypothetical protein
MFKTVVYDDAKPSQILEEFTSPNEVAVVKKATGAVRFLRESKEAMGQYTFRLTKEA